MKFEVTILGSNSAIPAHGRHPTAQILNFNDELFLIDCGEGTQMRMGELKVKRNKINNIFISHIHGDHVFGLIGLINSMNLSNRKKPLHVFGPVEVHQTIDFQLQLTKNELSFPLVFHETKMEVEQIVETSNLEVITIPLDHRVACTGFLFREKFRESNIRPEAIAQYELSVDQIKAVKNGSDIQTKSGETIPNKDLIKKKKKNRAYAFCTDTAYLESIIPLIQDVDLLYHEATFTESELSRAKDTFHCTGKQAATIAKKANVHKLLLGHFSARYGNLSPLLEEAQEIFPNTELAHEQVTFEVGS